MASGELGNRLLSKTPHLSKILAVPMVCSPAVFAKHPGRGLLSWDRLIHLHDRTQKWNLAENHLCRKRHSKTDDTQRNGEQLLQCRHASTWTSTVLQPGHRKANVPVMSSDQEYQKEEKKCKGNWHFYAEHSKCCIKKTKPNPRKLLPPNQPREGVTRLLYLSFWSGLLPLGKHCYVGGC